MKWDVYIDELDIEYKGIEAETQEVAEQIALDKAVSNLDINFYTEPSDEQ